MKIYNPQTPNITRISIKDLNDNKAKYINLIETDINETSLFIKSLINENFNISAILDKKNSIKSHVIIRDYYNEKNQKSTSFTVYNVSSSDIYNLIMDNINK